MSAASFWEALKEGALRQPRVCEWPGCRKASAEPEQARSGVKPERKGWKITMRDDSLAHQIRIRLVTGGPEIAVSCLCRDRADEGPLAARTRWEPDEPIALWREHMAAVGAA